MTRALTTIRESDRLLFGYVDRRNEDSGELAHSSDLPMNGADLLPTLARLLSMSSNAASASRIPEWEGWAVLGSLLIVFGALARGA
jgi:hypothetical protein